MFTELFGWISKIIRNWLITFAHNSQLCQRNKLSKNEGNIWKKYILLSLITIIDTPCKCIANLMVHVNKQK